MSLNKFKIAVSEQFDRMISKSKDTELFYVNMNKDEVYTVYLASFPEGTNPIYRKRTIHDCSSCKRFINAVGNVVAIIDGKIETIWDIDIGGFEQVVADALSQLVKFKSIKGIYRHREKTLGSKPHEEKLDTGIIMDYEHFHYILPSKFVSNDTGKFRGDTEANKEVLERSMEEISLDAAEVVLELIEGNQLYKGQEFKSPVQKFVEVKSLYELLPKSEVDQFLWLQSVKLKEFGRFKNTMIGTLLHDISSGIDVETAVKKYESKAAPMNYKRPKPVVTQQQLDRAGEQVTELGIEKSLKRRLATDKDMTVNNVYYADLATKKKMKKSKKKKGVFADIEPTKLVVDADKVKSMSMDEFVYTILPHVNSVEAMVENRHTNNMMSVIAPFYWRSPNIMKWNNPFSWSYAGEVTDSIRALVKKAGGSVTGYGRISLRWFNHDDLDIHVKGPNRSHIFYGNKKVYNGGELDVDMNVGRLTREPVENITWETARHMTDGKYKVYVNQFTKRETDNIGFQVEMVIDGDIKLFTYDKDMRSNEDVPVIDFTHTSNGITDIQSLPLSSTSKELWGVDTQKWSKVKMLMASPNHWNGEKTGNKHWFFILENCLNPGKARGFYNEFLRNDLKDHRKVFELLSSKMKTEITDKQLSGVGFSETQQNYILVKVSGKFDRIIKIEFAPNMVDRFSKPVREYTIEEVGFCEVCKKYVTNNDNRIVCPNGCDHVFHTSHYLESVRVSGKCPVCRLTVSQRLINQAILLIK